MALEKAELNAYDVLCNEWVVFTQDLLPTAAPDPELEPPTM